MKCRHIRDRIVATADAALPEPVRTHLAACEACRRFAEGDARVRRWMALGRETAPDPGFERRLIAGVWAQIDGGAAGETERGEGFALPMPILRFGMAALLLGMVAFHFLSQEPSPAPRFADGSRRATAPAPALGLAPIVFPAGAAAESPSYGLRLPPDTNLPPLHWPAPAGYLRPVSQ
jgi:hypothetical protein